jgi:hypothetical protein
MIAVPLKEAVKIPSEAPEQRGENKSVAGERLDSWKEIAAYLRRSVRCVQRWERMEGLPILRHRHVKGATVYAYRHEVDQWLQEGRTVVTEGWRSRAEATNQLREGHGVLRCAP